MALQLHLTLNWPFLYLDSAAIPLGEVYFGGPFKN